MREAAPPPGDARELRELRTFFDNAFVGVTSADAEGRLLRFNAAFARLLGYGPGEEGELLGRTLASLSHPDEPHALLLPRLLAGEAEGLRVEKRYRRRDGSWVWARVSASLAPAGPGEPRVTVGVVEDITEERRTREALRESEARLRLLGEASFEGIVVSMGGYIRDTSPVFDQMFGYAPGEPLGLPITAMVVPEEQERVATLARADTREAYETVGVRKDGTRFALEVRGRSLELGGRTARLAALRDVSERKRAETLKDQLISTASHELRSPLTAIRGSLQLLSGLGGIGALGPQERELLEMAQRNTSRLLRLVNGVLDVERLESGATLLERHAVPAREVVSAALELTRASADAAGIRLEVEPSSAVAWADPDRLTQVLVNLLANAVKFSPAGSTVRLGTVQESERVRFWVQDAGRGIPADRLESIFERFVQVDASDAREKGGSGLGLAIARAIVHQHEGRIWVVSAVGEGSTFHFTVPTAASALARSG
ncbi:PAS domain S-box protein [Aggregicoccus sp. 17bor-14]|uniref:PAS domain S-box protein n=1 Tax=Myxococcaceae TaxID=31 RepID=UPI00129D1BF0|nr:MULTISPECIES: PAS domain S-box protein [Myxococcaceae]MBF5045496.1 PAS domain S-box protein [Simulacricoccus sp. 17bor-14]MRI91233.1 PAS domain S-box protein [Aggregicoccus sp. 17bor-14]